MWGNAARPKLIAISPFERPDARLVAALSRAGALGVLDVGRDERAALAALDELVGAAPGPFGVRVPEGAALDPARLPEAVSHVVLPEGAPLAPWRGRQVLVQATSVAAARAAVAGGAEGVVAKGAESGGRVGDEGAFILFQRIRAEVGAPVWVQGGIGPHTAAACIAGGAAGVVLDAQLALLPECGLPEPVRAALAAMDGGETAVLGGYRVYTRPDLPVARLTAGDATGLPARFGAGDLVRDVLPAGQDGALAGPFRERYRTAAGVAGGLREAVGRALRQAQAVRPLAEGAPLAQEHGIRYPIAQGPMTRVSDRAAFAAAVADAGGLPFLALAVMREREVRALLAETAERLGERAWGVGVLGFVPPALREEQLGAIRAVRPPVALVAGGRPSHARRLEDVGVATYLHAPSPGLLDLFLREGVRRFVFEGSECGGHVGPRTSFALWESQLDRLDRHDAPEELSVLFAGGIHDARSGAMATALAAPLARRGARVGVLLGTAYLFTEEAVATGAIQPAFQEAAIACEETTLLETAPGHVTRCAPTPYVETFRAERERLEREGACAGDKWLALEDLNLGRLRIAAKGLRREGDRLAEVGPDVQRREGMVMIGQAAALQRATRSVAQLHDDVSRGGQEVVDALDLGEAPARGRGRSARPADVAIVGMAALFPGAPDVETFWANVVGGVDSVTEVPPGRWDPEQYFVAEPDGGDSTPSKWGGFLDDVIFDPSRYGIPPLSLAAIEPVQLLALEVSRAALADAGLDGADLSRTSVVFGAEPGSEVSSAYTFRTLWRHYFGAPIPDALDELLPRVTEDSFPGILANVIAGRIANRLDLGGANYTVDAACASALAALDVAVKELAAGTSDVVLCGGADLHNNVNDYLLFAGVRALSRTGRCRTFDARADGIVLGEGVAAVVLKRLADAERDGDRVYAVVKGVGSASDGRSLGLTAPRYDGQVRALERAYAAAGVSPADVGLVEAHGTGTVVGDRTELAALTEVFAAAGSRPGRCALGSVKSQIGHTKCTAGMAGLVKVALGLHHRVLPPTLHVEEPNPAWDPERSPFALNAVARPWPGSGRRAAVSAFGFGGTNFHAVLAEADGSAVGSPVWPAELFLFRGADRESAGARMDALGRVLDGGAPLRELARSVLAGGDGPVQAAVVATGVDDLAAKLRAARAWRGDGEGVFVARPGGGRQGKLAFVFPGQGSQRVDMLRDVFLAFPALQELLGGVGEGVAERIFPSGAWSAEARRAQRAALDDTRVAQPALGVVELAMARLLASLGVRPDMAGGHSYGELAALGVAGAMDEAELISLSAERGRQILAAARAAGRDSGTGGPDVAAATGPPLAADEEQAARAAEAGAATADGPDAGTMAAVSAPASVVAEALAGLDGVVIANENAPDQVAISGPTAGVEAAAERLRARGISVRALPVACAFHSPLVAAASTGFAAALERASLRAPSVPVYSSATAAPYPAAPAAMRDLLAAHVARPVRFVAEVEAMYADGARVFVEVGPGRVLTGLIGRILGGRPHLALATDVPGEHGVTRLLHTLAALAVSGIEVDADPLFTGRGVHGFDLDDPPDCSVPATAWRVNGHLATPLHGEMPAHGFDPARRPVRGAVAAVDGAPSRNGDATGRNGDDRASAHSDGDDPAAARRPGDEPPAARRRGDERAPARRLGGDSAAAGVGDDPAEAAAEASPASVHDLVLGTVSEKTGYPIAMLALDLDLEAELSIDSIKRTEILGLLVERLGVGDADGDGEDLLEKLAPLKTLRGICERLGELVPAAAAPEPPAPVEAAPAGATATAGFAVEPEPAAAGTAVEPEPSGTATLMERGRSGPARYVVGVEDADPVVSDPSALAGKAVAVAGDDRGVADLLVRSLEEAGATAMRIGEGEPVPAVAALVDLSSLRPEPSPGEMTTLFRRVRDAVVLRGADTVLAASGAGVAGLLKSVAQERPEVRFRVVDLDPQADPARLADHLFAELCARDDLKEVRYAAGRRKIPRVVPAGPPDAAGIALDRDSVVAAAPSDAAGIALDHDSVVLATGGGRGITAQAAIALARRFRCTLELVGRTPPPAGEEAEALRGAADLPALRRALISTGWFRDPVLVEAACRRVLAERELRATFAALRAAGAPFRYHTVDVRDGDALAALIADLYDRHGRLDGVIHGAGVLEDRLLEHKTPESFARVFETKVTGALTLARELRDDVRFVAFFSSVSGTFGNRGQTDVAAANDFLDKLAVALNERIAGRAVSIAWGPWSGVGMVTPELERVYAARGIELLSPDEGAQAFVSELLHGGAGDAHVILTRGEV